MSATARGGFEVTLAPQPAEPGSTLGRLTIEKRYRGDLDGTSRGQMLAFTSAVKGSAGYVAMEEVRGTLLGRSGTFVLQHRGVITRSVPELVVTVVPDSGTGDLAGLAGAMQIIIEGGNHSYLFDYTLPGTP
ncbi:MAG TPA: DUF3224 domain-containing protein [Gemmatimonadales bacterium]|nr:DUF3224 domain-containing protein [Gemmatimonadales bacterium]